MLQLTNVKINIGLDILRRRPDGYHDIATAMVPVEWHDIVEVVPSPDEDTHLHCTGRTVDCPVDKNLVMKAYRAFSEQIELPAVDIYLHKMVPDGAGLGGGSADAAFTIRCLNDLFSTGLSDENLAAIALRVGADCPFFIYNRPMMAEGIGELFTPLHLNLQGYTIGIVKPALHISTAEAYAGVTPREPQSPLHERLGLPVDQWRHCVTNAFEESLFPRYSELPRIKEALYGMGAVYASMSGSGAALYGLFYKNDDLSARLEEQFVGCDIFCAEL